MRHPPTDRETFGLVADLYAAAPDPDRWPDVLARAAALAGAAAASVTFAEREAGAPWRTEPWRTEPWRTEPWRTERVVFGDACARPTATAARPAAPAGDAVRARASLACGHHGLVATTVSGDGRAALELVLHRNEIGRPFGAAEVGWAERLLPHLARARDGRLRWRALASAAASHAAALDALGAALGAACLAVDAGARVLWTNTAADLLLACHDGLVVRDDDRLGATAPDAEAHLRAAVRRCASEGVAADPCGVATSCPRRPPAGPLAATVLPLGRGGRDGAAAAPHASPAALVVVRAPNASDDAGGRWRDAAGRFHLTPAERRVAVLVCEGRSVPEIAESARVSAGTVRNHLKSVFAKTGVRRQAELVARLLAAPARPVPFGTGAGDPPPVWWHVARAAGTARRGVHDPARRAWP